MAQKSAKAKAEQLRDEDFSSEDIETHTPKKEEEELEVDERAYSLIEYINMEWPAQSIAVQKHKIYMGTNPQPGEGPCELLEINLNDADFTNLNYRDAKIERSINKIAIYGDTIFALSDGQLSAFGMDLKLKAEVQDKYAYGLHVTASHVYAGTCDGRLIVYDHALNIVNQAKLHKKGIETIAVASGHVYTGSIDGKLHQCDAQLNIIRSIDSHSEINCMDISTNRLIFGDDNAKLHLVSLDTFEEEIIAWHNTPITDVRWKDDDVFASASDEQVCLWDITMVEEWEYHRYLLFVHQGQTYYKSIQYSNNMVITASIDGLCCFIPVSFEAANLDESEQEQT